MPKSDTQFKPGCSGHGAGRPRAGWRKAFDAAIEADTIKHKQSIFEHAVIEARKDNTLLASVLRKCLPDLQAVKTEIISGTPFGLIIGIMPVMLPGQVTADTKELNAATPVIPVSAIIGDVVKPNKRKAEVKKLESTTTTTRTTATTPKSKRKRTTKSRASKRRKTKSK